MPSGGINKDILLNAIKSDIANGTSDANRIIRRQYPELTESQCTEIAEMISNAMSSNEPEKLALVVTAPPTFTIKAKPTKITVEKMIHGASRSILITGYSLSDYFSELVDEIIQKSQRGVFVKFFVNDIDHQSEFDRILRYKGRFLRVYNYPKREDDRMAAFHAKVISVDKKKTLITSANLSYHGQEGNLELGTYTESSSLARQVDELFTQLIFRKVFTEV